MTADEYEATKDLQSEYRATLHKLEIAENALRELYDLADNDEGTLTTADISGRCSDALEAIEAVRPFR